MRTPQGLLLVFLISGLLLGTCLSEQACVDDACFDQRIQQLKIDRSKTDPASGLKYVERSTDLVATVDVIGVCLPGVNPNVLADTFLSCSNKKMEEVCTMVKRGWLEDKEGKSVVNENAVLATFKELDGGEDAVRECLQIPEVYEYEYYYLEESASGSRQRRAASSNEAGQKQKKRKGKNSARKGKKGKQGNSPVGKGGKKRTEKRNRKNNRKARKQNNKKTTKHAQRKKERKARKQEKKKAKKEKKEAKKKAKKEAVVKAWSEEDAVKEHVGEVDLRPRQDNTAPSHLCKEHPFQNKLDVKKYKKKERGKHTVK